MRLSAAIYGFAVLGCLAFDAAPDLVPAAAAQSATTGAQNPQARKPRARTQIRVYRGYPYRHYHSAYPVPYAVEYPGPNGVRQCVNRYVTERRPSGSVIVPHMRCTWVVRR